MACKILLPCEGMIAVQFHSHSHLLSNDVIGLLAGVEVVLLLGVEDRIHDSYAIHQTLCKQASN